MQITHPVTQEPLPKMAELNRLLAPYQKSDTRRSLWQLANTLIPYFALWGLMIYTVKFSIPLTLALSLVAVGFLVRIFIFFHDCGHNSFFKDTRWNRLLGFWLGVLVFTPGEQWWHSHAIHHATSGNLDKRGTGDVATLTVDEFYQTTWVGKVGYRLFRNPAVMFILGPLYMFVISHRFAMPNYGKKQTNSVIFTNLAMLAIAVVMSLLIGWKEYILIQLPIIWLGGVGGIWLFYVQHQFEDGYWEHGDQWDYVASALLGASFYRLPKVLQWFSGSIGFHHIHHLSPRIPNYNLEPAHNNIPLIQRWAREIDLWESVGLARLKLWNEQLRKMVGFTPSRQPDSAPAPKPRGETASGD